MKKKRIIWIGLLFLILSIIILREVLTEQKEKPRLEGTDITQVDNQPLSLVLSDEALHQWGFDEGVGKVTNDYAQSLLSDIHYALDSDPEWRDGISGKALLFDGYSNWIEIPAEDVHHPKGSFSIEAWVAPRAYEWGDQGQPSVIMNQHDKENKQGFMVGMGRHGYITFQLALDGEWHEIWSPEGIVLPKDNWSYIVAQFEKGKNKISLYLNGELVIEKEVPFDSEFTPTNDLPLLVGKHNQTVAVSEVFHVNMFNGLMDNVSLYDKAFDHEYIKQHYKEFRQNLNNEMPVPDTSFDRTGL